MEIRISIRIQNGKYVVFMQTDPKLDFLVIQGGNFDSKEDAIRALPSMLLE